MKILHTLIKKKQKKKTPQRMYFWLKTEKAHLAPFLFVFFFCIYPCALSTLFMNVHFVAGTENIGSLKVLIPLLLPKPADAKSQHVLLFIALLKMPYAPKGKCKEKYYFKMLILCWP